MVRLVAQDPVWIAGVKRAMVGWQWETLSSPQFDFFATWEALEDTALSARAELKLVEVGRENLQQFVASLSRRPPHESWQVVALLERTGPHAFLSPADRAMAATLLHEAGASFSIASPRALSRAMQFAQRFFLLRASTPGDALDTLPLACWGPGWQTGGAADRLVGCRPEIALATGRG